MSRPRKNDELTYYTIWEIWFNDHYLFVWAARHEMNNNTEDKRLEYYISERI